MNGYEIKVLTSLISLSLIFRIWRLRSICNYIVALVNVKTAKYIILNLTPDKGAKGIDRDDKLA